MKTNRTWAVCMGAIAALTIAAGCRNSDNTQAQTPAAAQPAPTYYQQPTAAPTTTTQPTATAAAPAATATDIFSQMAGMVGQLGAGMGAPAAGTTAAPAGTPAPTTTATAPGMPPIPTALTSALAPFLTPPK